MVVRALMKTNQDLKLLATGVARLLEKGIAPYWQDEDDWLCTIEFLPG
jgi:hypothetical protein